MTPAVLIIGGGPVGLTLACELARFRVPVRIIDKNAQRTDKSKALVLWSRTLELLDRGPDGAAPFVQAGFKADAVNFIAGEKLIGRVSMDAVPSPFPYGLMIPQSDTERLLEERLLGLGVSVEREVELVDFSNLEDRVEAVLRRADGREERVTTDWMVGCDGAHSAVRHGLGAPFAGESLPSDWMLADVHMTGYPCPDTEASVYWHDDGAFVIFPISPGRYRLLADQPPIGAEHPPTPTLEQVQSIVDRRGPSGMKVFDPIWLAGFRINGRKVSNYRWGRTFLSGDAAHVHSPAGGQGMNTGMQDAFNLAWKLAWVVRGLSGDALLDSYSLERSAVGDEVLKAAGRLTMIGTLRNPALQAVRNLVGHLMFGLRPVQEAFAESMTEMSISYPQSPLNGHALHVAGPKPGERVVPLSGQTPVGSGDTPRFALCGAKTEESAALVRRFDAVLEPEVRPALGHDGFWLVRPDGYLASSAADVNAIAQYLIEQAHIGP